MVLERFENGHHMVLHVTETHVAVACVTCSDDPDNMVPFECMDYTEENMTEQFQEITFLALDHAQEAVK